MTTLHAVGRAEAAWKIAQAGLEEAERKHAEARKLAAELARKLEEDAKKRLTQLQQPAPK